MSDKRAVCCNCIDGRAQLPVINWIKDAYNMDHVDMITEPGVDGFMADQDNSIDEIKRKINISIDKNNASMIVVVGHHDCQANSVSEVDHHDHIHAGVDRLKKEFPHMDVQGLWINSEWAGEAL